MKEIKGLYTYVSRETYEWLKKKSFEEKRNMAEIIRDIIEEKQKYGIH